MKQTQFLWLPSLFFLLLMFSCTREDRDQPTPVLPVDNTRLIKVYEVDSTKQAPTDTISRWSFSYDNAGRIISDSFFNTSLYYNASLTRIRKMQYANSSTFASRSTTKRYLTFGNSTIGSLLMDTTNHTFVNGRCISDTVVYDHGSRLINENTKTTFSYQPGMIIRSFQNWTFQPPYSIVERDTIHQRIVDGNIVHQLDTIRRFIDGQLAASYGYETTISYLPNPNPFFKVFNPTANSYLVSLGIGNFITNEYAPEHLISQQNSTRGKVKYDYSFRPDGYPLTARVTVEFSTLITVTKLLFVYAEN